MSEEKTKADLILEQLQKLKTDYEKGKTDLETAIKALSDVKPPDQHQATQGHKTIDEVADCPNCRPKLIEKFKPDIEKELRPIIEKELKEKHKSIKEPVVCDGCGEVVEKTEKECPSCHGRKAH